MGNYGDNKIIKQTFSQYLNFDIYAFLFPLLSCQNFSLDIYMIQSFLYFDLHFCSQLLFDSILLFLFYVADFRYYQMYLWIMEIFLQISLNSKHLYLFYSIVKEVLLYSCFDCMKESSFLSMEN